MTYHLFKRYPISFLQAFCIGVLCLFMHIGMLAQNKSPDYRPIEKEKWEKVVKGRDYTEKSAEPKEAETGMHVPEAGTGLSPLLRILLYAAIIALIVFILFKIFGKGIFSKNKQRKKTELITVKDLEERPMETDLERFLREALERKDYKLAIRVYYLMILRSLHQKELIKWKRNKTNRDYVLETFDKKFHPLFTNNTLLFEYTWYGEMGLKEAQFHSIKQSFINLIDIIHKIPV